MKAETVWGSGEDEPTTVTINVEGDDDIESLMNQIYCTLQGLGYQETTIRKWLKVD